MNSLMLCSPMAILAWPEAPPNRPCSPSTRTFCSTVTARLHHNKFKNPDHPEDVIRNWLCSRSTVEFLGLWERLNNSSFNPVEFDGVRMQTGLNSFVLTPKQWIEKTGAVGICSSAGRYGGTYAHKKENRLPWGLTLLFRRLPGGHAT